MGFSGLQLSTVAIFGLAIQAQCQFPVTPPNVPSVTITSSGHDKGYSGISTHAWAEDKTSWSVATDYGFGCFRSSVGPDWGKLTEGCSESTTDKPTCPPIGKEQDAYDNFVASHFDADCEGGAKCHSDALTAIADAKAAGLKWIQIQFHLPIPIVSSDNGVKIFADHLSKDYVLFYGAVANYVKTQANISPDYFEISNEPDADWDAKISPPTYVNLLKQVYTTLVARGYVTSLIGPGTSQFDPAISGPYIDALDADALKVLGAFSVHGWDQVGSHGPNYDALKTALAAKDPNKPVIVSEYGLTNNADRGSAGYANDLTKLSFELLQRQPLVLSQWEASDVPSEGSNVWGLADPAGVPYPAGQLFQHYLPYLRLVGACHFDLDLGAVPGMVGAAVRGSLNGTDSVVAVYWNAGEASVNFKHSVVTEGYQWKVTKSIRLDGGVPDQNNGYQGLDQVSMSANSGAVYVFTSAPPARKMMSF